MRRFFLLLAVVSLLMVPATIAEASPPTPITGEFLLAGGPLFPPELRSADGNLIMTAVFPFAYLGQLSGTSTEETHLVFHPNETFQVEIIDSCACNLYGRSGTLISRIVGTGHGTPNGGTYTGTWTVISATDDLAGLHLTAKFVGTIGVGGSYTGAYHFDP